MSEIPPTPHKPNAETYFVGETSRPAVAAMAAGPQRPVVPGPSVDHPEHQEPAASASSPPQKPNAETYLVGTTPRPLSAHHHAVSVGQHAPPAVMDAGAQLPGAGLSVEMPESEWTTGVCECFLDMASCCDVLWCHYCQSSRQYNMVNKGSPDIDWLVCMGLFCIDSTTACGMPAIACYTRQALRRRYNIPGSDLQDACASLWLSLCVVCQNYREMSTRGAWPQGCCISEPYVRRDMRRAVPQPMQPMGRELNVAPPVPDPILAEQ